MNTPAFRLGYMTKIAELAKSPVDHIIKIAAGASMSAEDYARRGIVVPWAKTKTQLANPAPSMTPEQYASRGIKPFAPRRTAAGLTEMMNRHLDEGDAAADSFISEGASGEQADDTYMREQARQDQANRDEIAEYMAGMSPEDRSAFLAQKAKTPEGTVAVGRDGKPIESYYAARARQAVSEPGAPVMKTRAQLNAEESAERASRWAGNSTIKWTPKGTSTVQPGTSTSYVSTTPATPEMRARNAVASGRATLKPAPMAGRPNDGDGLLAFNDAFPEVNTSAVDTSAVASKPSLRVRYNARTGAYTRADGSTTPWTDKERAALEKYHAGQNRTTPINWNPTTVTQGFQQSFGKGSAGKDVTVARPVRRKQVAATTHVKPWNGV